MRTRARRIAVRVSEEQYNKISRLTERSFFTKEQVLRDIILGYPIQEDRKPECMEFILKLRGIASTLNNIFRNYGLSDLPIGKEMKQTADDELISFNPAVELAALKGNEQKELIEAMDYAQSVPSLSQAQRMKKLSKEGKLSLEKMQDILSEIKKGEISRVTFTNEQLHRYFPNNYTPEMMKREIVAILKIWMEQYWDK